MPTDTPTAISGCGDGTLSAGEECDDGNLVNGDGCDANCTVECGTPVATPKLVIRKLDTPPGDDKLIFRGKATLPVPFNPPLDPLANGVRLLIDHTAGSVLDITIPGGAFVYPPGIGWKVNRRGTRWIYRNRSLTPVGGIIKILIKDRSATTPGLVQFVVRGKAGAYVVTPTNLPVTGRIVLHPPVEQCAAATFRGPAPSCAFNASGSTLRCK